MSVYFTSDWHLGHKKVAELRGFKSVEEHDAHIITKMQRSITKKDKLFILGDVVVHHSRLPLLKEVPGIKVIVLGNHDKLRAREYLKYAHDIHGVVKYNCFWVTHVPVHPQEMWKLGNIHGHIHHGGSTGVLGYPYFCVNVDLNLFEPVEYFVIEQWFDAQKRTHSC